MNDVPLVSVLQVLKPHFSLVSFDELDGRFRLLSDGTTSKLQFL